MLDQHQQRNSTTEQQLYKHEHEHKQKQHAQ